MDCMRCARTEREMKNNFRGLLLFMRRLRLAYEEAHLLSLDQLEIDRRRCRWNEQVRQAVLSAETAAHLRSLLRLKGISSLPAREKLRRKARVFGVSAK